MTEPVDVLQHEEVLSQCNETELLELARWARKLPLLRRGIPHADLVAIVGGYRMPRADELSTTIETRYRLQNFINRPDIFWKVKGQLPGCDGQCTTFPCSEGRHLMCLAPNKRNLT